MPPAVPGDGYLSQGDCDAAIEGTDSKYRQAASEAVAETFKLWGTVVDINPCVFNCVVKVFETLADLKEAGVSDDFIEFAGHYKWETDNGHSHYVTGAVALGPGDVDSYVQALERMYRVR